MGSDQNCTPLDAVLRTGIWQIPPDRQSQSCRVSRRWMVCTNRAGVSAIARLNSAGHSARRHHCTCLRAYSADDSLETWPPLRRVTARQRSGANRPKSVQCLLVECDVVLCFRFSYVSPMRLSRNEIDGHACVVARGIASASDTGD